MSHASDPADEARIKDVAIFGAGIAGLTAAHELIERGYRVEVFEPTKPSLEEEICSIGGFARTQWSRASRPPGPYDPERHRPTLRSTEMLCLETESDIENQKVEFDHKSCELNDTAKRTLELLAKDIEAAASVYADLKLTVYGFKSARELRSEGKEQPKIDEVRARKVCWYLAEILGVKVPLVPAGLGLGLPDDWAASERARRVVSFHILQDYIPGEHGFRFFPTFYRNLRDTMKRTPVAENIEPFVETFRTVFDNLVQVPAQGINLDADGKKMRTFVLPRHPVRSAEQFFKLLVDSLEVSGFKFADMQRLLLKLFKFMTSCPERREQYESMSWWDFLEGDRYSTAFQKYLNSTPQALLAMSAHDCDARTYGDITLQLMMDQLVPGDRTDATLNGPTSIAFLHPWRRYLESQGVKFRRGKLLRFEIFDPKMHLSPDEQLDPSTPHPVRIWPIVVIEDDLDKCESEQRHFHIIRDYYVVALPPDELRRILNRNQELKGDDMDAIRGMDLGDDADPVPKGEMRHLSGIQFYFPTEATFLAGHIVYPDAPWGLSSISQPQFWNRKRGWWDGYRSLLTVGIGNWNNPGLKGDANGSQGEIAWDCTRERIAWDIWHQIKKTVPEADSHRVPDPTLFHIDENIIFGTEEPRKGLPVANKTRMLINLPGRYAYRPGVLNGLDGYDVYYGSLVFAGVYMRTFTRLTTMEAANESARHAVNGILRVDGYKGDRCAVDNPEDNELPDLQYFRDLDAELCCQHLPHFVDILNPETLPAEWLGGKFDLSRFGIPVQMGSL